MIKIISLQREDKNNDTKLIVFHKGNKDAQGVDTLGHYLYMDHDGKMFDFVSHGADCGFAVFSHLTGKSMNQLRQEKHMRLHKQMSINV